MNKPADKPNNKLTIVSRGLLRVTNEEWATPEDHFERLRDHALDLLLTAAASGSPAVHWANRRALLLFDCLLRVIDESPMSSAIAFATARFQTLQMLFYGALCSERFIDTAETSRTSMAYNFYTVLNRLAEVTTVQLADHHQKVAGRIPEGFVQALGRDNVPDRCLCKRGAPLRVFVG